MLILARSDIEELLTMPAAIAAVEEAFRRLAAGEVVMPQRIATPIAPHKGLHLSMPAFVANVDGVTAADGVLTIKVVTVYGDNPTRYGMPTIQGLLLLHDARTGAAVALMDAEHLTAMRTGAAAGVATRLLARPDAATVTIFGAGAQAGPQVAAICAVRPIRQAYVVTRTGSRDHDFCAHLSRQLGITVTPMRDVRAAVETADVICTATNSSTPLFPGAWLRPGVHINAIGAYTRAMRELDGVAVQRAHVIVDHLPAAQAEAGDILLAQTEGAIGPDHVVGSLGQLLAGEIAGRTSPEQITLFKSVGLAMQDAVTAARVYRAAVERGEGQKVAL
ncbi:MAG: ornithine cyclodeaminase [Caldilineaceae bacterium]|nr:ornithine cyclodeaminase [Caldilineaceae bacterium]